VRWAGGCVWRLVVFLLLKGVSMMIAASEMLMGKESGACSLPKMAIHTLPVKNPMSWRRYASYYCCGVRCCEYGSHRFLFLHLSSMHLYLAGLPLYFNSFV
jgi:hypothetical protein